MEEDPFGRLFEGMEFVDDITGWPLIKALAIEARKKEIEYFRRMGVYTKIRREKWMKLIDTKWIDQNKGDARSPTYRARLVGREIKRDERKDLFAATPPLETLRLIVSTCASNQHSLDPDDDFVIMYNDVKRAYFHAPAKRPVYIKIPVEDWEEGDEDRVGVLNLSLYGTRDAAMNWANKYTEVLTQIGFTVGTASPCNFHHENRNISVTVHGDDFTSTGRPRDLQWLDMKMKEEFEMTTEVFGPGPARKQQVRILNRVLTWKEDGIDYEADQRHAEIIIEELGLKDAKPLATPGTRDDAARAGPPNTSTIAHTVTYYDKALQQYRDVTTTSEETQATGTADDFAAEEGPCDAEELLEATEARTFRALAARLNYLAQDRPDLQYAAKEVSRRMARPSHGDWKLLKRVGRYLVGAPRAVQSFEWQASQYELDTFVDSDWAGCKTTCRSTSGGAVRLGWHTIRTWSSTQATVAMSSAEAELFALTKGASTSLGLISLARDLGLQLDAKVHSDASAALAIAQRQGLGKVRHLRVQYLWVQEKVRRKDLTVHKVNGKLNPADLLTKHLPVAEMKFHTEALGFQTSTSRASIAPQLNREDREGHGRGADEWNREEDGKVSMNHVKPRRCLFTPVRVQGAPPAKSLTATRETRGVFCDDGKTFIRRDNWTARASAHLDLGRRWIGITTFLLKACECDHWDPTNGRLGSTARLWGGLGILAPITHTVHARFIHIHVV